MITALVQFQLAQPIDLDAAKRLSEESAPAYKGKEGLLVKQYVRSEDGRTVGGIYLWADRAAAEACYDDAWRERVTAAYGSAPSITWFHTPVVVDNRHGEIVSD